MSRALSRQRGAGRTWTRRRVAGLLVAIVVLGLLVRMIHFASLCSTNYPEVMLATGEMDMSATWDWSGEILAGDILGRDTYHPSFAWGLEIAPLETWHRWWGQKEIFQQAPVYPYAVALMRGLTRGSHRGVLLLQLLLGALHPLVLFFVGRRLFGAKVGLVAAALTAVYGPLVFHQGALLRDWLPPLLDSLALLCLLRGRQEGRRLDWLAAGVFLGLGVLTRPTSAPFAVFAVAWALLDRTTGPTRTRADWRSAAVVTLGGLMCLLPLTLRNAAVGAPMLSISNRFSVGWIGGNAGDAHPVGLTFPESLGPILVASEGRPLAVVARTWESHANPWTGMARLQLLKLRGVLEPWEVPNNISDDYGREISPVLRWLLTYGAILPLALASLLINLRRWRRHALLLALLACHVLSLQLFIVLGRYRLALMTPLVLYAGWGLIQFVKALRARRPSAVKGAALAILLLVLQQQVVPLRELRAHVLYVPEYSLAATLYAEAGDYARALTELERMKARVLAMGSDSPLLREIRSRSAGLHLELATQALRAGDRRETREHLVKAEALLGADPPADATRVLGALRLGIGDREEAMAHFRRFLEQEPDSAFREELEELLGAGSQ